MKRFVIAVMVVLMFCTTFFDAVSEGTEWEGVSWLHRQYGFTMDQAFLDEAHAAFQDMNFECGPVRITLKEVLCDGVWMYTSSVAAPVDDHVIVLPSDAEITDLVSGGYGEELRDDHRTFLQAAAEDQKDLVWVEVLPDEYLNADFYFADHRQDAGEESTLFNGAPVMLKDGENVIHFTVRTCRISPYSGESLSENEYSFPIEFQRTPTQEAEYNTSTEGVPFDKILLVQTPLATHVFPGSETEAEYVLLDENMQGYDAAIPEDGTSLKMDELPRKIIVRFYDGEGEFQDVEYHIPEVQE